MSRTAKTCSVRMLHLLLTLDNVFPTNIDNIFEIMGGLKVQFARCLLLFVK